MGINGILFFDDWFGWSACGPLAASCKLHIKRLSIIGHRGSVGQLAARLPQVALP